jgi:DNA-binding CsgD family transcriptional regulator
MLEGLEQRFLDAPFVAGGWNLALDALARATGSTRASLSGADSTTHIAFHHVSNPDDNTRAYVRDFAEIGGLDSAVNWRAALLAGQFKVLHEEHYRTLRREKRYALYNDFAAKYDSVSGCHTQLVAKTPGAITLVALRSRADGVPEPKDVELFTALSPTVLKAIRLQQAIDNQGAELLRGSLDAMQAAAFVLGPVGEIIGMTPLAARLATDHSVVAVVGRSLRATDRASNQRLQSVIAAALRAPGQPMATRLWLKRPGEVQDGVVCEVHALPVREWQFGATPTVIVSIKPPAGIDPATASLLQQSFELSAAEADVALLLSRGLSRAEIAGRRGVSLETVAAQLKTIYRKTDCHREAELVALVVRLAV